MTDNNKEGRSDNNTKDLCMLHGPNPIHDTKNYRDLKKHVEMIKMKTPIKMTPTKLKKRRANKQTARGLLARKNSTSFPTYPLSKRLQWMWRTKNSEILVQVNGKKESLKLKNIVINCQISA